MALKGPLKVLKSVPISAVMRSVSYIAIDRLMIILVGPHLDHASLVRNIANIQSLGLTNVKADSRSVALGDLAGVMDARTVSVHTVRCK